MKTKLYFKIMLNIIRHYYCNTDKWHKSELVFTGMYKNYYIYQDELYYFKGKESEYIAFLPDLIGDYYNI